MLIDIFDTDLRTHVQPDGDDIMFKTGYIWCPHEIALFDQTYNETHAHLIAWVKTDLSSSIDTTITMYYGNPGLPAQERPDAVWSSYVGAWHLDESPTGIVYDSSPYNNDGVTLGSMSGSDLVPGQIGSGFELDGIDDMINVSESSSLDLIKYAGTISIWVNWVDSSDGGYQRIFTTSDRFDPPNIQVDGFEWAVQSDGDNFFYPWGGNSIDYNLVTNPFTNGVWHYATLTLDYSTKSVVMYLDGVPLSLAIENVPSEWTQLASLDDWLWGGNDVITNSQFLGKFDEIRVSNIVRSSEWILTEYNNQYNPSSFYSVGSEVQISGEGYIFTTSSESSVTIGAKLSLEVQMPTQSYADDFTLGTSFSIVNGSLPIWTAGVLVSPPPELDSISFEISYPEGEWWPFSVKSPSGIELTFATDWTCFDGRLIVSSTAIDEYGMWQLQFLDRNHILDTQMGPAGGPYSTTSQFTLGDDIQFRVWSSGTIGSTIALELRDPSGSTWYTGTTTFQGQRFTLPYHHRKYLTISHENVAESLVNFPVLVDIYDTDLQTDVRSDGRDIAFTIGEETLSHEIELFDQSYNGSHAHFVAWVNVPLLSGSSDTVITMYYGNPLAPIVYDSGPVWDAGYLGVWHLGESGTGALDEYLDSSQYKNHGQGGEGNSSFIPTRVTGKIGSGQDFNNIDGYYDLIDCGDSPLWDIDGYQITLEAWVQHDITPNTHVYGIMNHKGWYDGYALYVNYGGSSTLKPTFSLPGDTHQLRGANDVTGSSWHHIVATYDGSLMRIYMDGIQDPNVLAKTNAIAPSSFEKAFWIGHGDQPKDRGWSAEWDGQIDEVRISDVVRSAGWIQTQFENQYDPSSFYSVSIEENIGYSESASINLDTSVPAGVWLATARYSDGSSVVHHRVGMFSRSFIVKRGVSLNLAAPGDAIADGISTKLIGEQLYVEFELEDTLNAAMVSGATVSMNWSVSGMPTDVQLNDYGDGRYGKTLNTSDLGGYGRWRLDLEASHPFYTNTTDFFYLDLSHRTFLTYVPPPDAPYGDDFEIRLTLKDQFDNAPLSGATISCNGTILGSPIDYGNGTYLVSVDSTGLSIGEHTFRFTAEPSSSFLLSSIIDVQFNYRPIATDATPLSPDAVEAPWSQQANTSIYWYDIDHAGIGVEGGSLSISPFVQTQTFEEGSGYYNITIDVSSLAPGTYYFNLTFSKLNYQSSTTTISILVLAHRTSLSVDYNSTIPVGTDAYFDVSWLDLDLDSIGVGSGNLSQITLDWGTGSDSYPAFGFWLDTSGWAVGSYFINVSISATEFPRFYMDSYIVIQLEIRKLKVYLSWDPLEPFPNGNDFVMFIYVNVSEPGSPIDGTPITGLDQSYFSARNETGGLYTFESFTNLGNGLYQITIDSARFLEGQYKIIVFVDFLPTENYTDTNTPQVPFTYRPILTYLSSPDYPTVTTSFDTNVTVRLLYVDIDHVQNITTGLITSEGASIVWQHIGNGVYEVLIVVQGWDLGAHEVNLTADASSYQAKTLTFQILVQIAYAYARSSVTIVDLPVGDTAVFYADYWDITHDEPIIGATIDHNWTYPLVVSWTGDQYRIELPSMDTNGLSSYLVIFNFSKGPNYQFGYFNLSIILRTHLTEFRLASAVEPTSYNAMVNISVYCGDLDNDAGIIDAPVNLSIYGESGWILATVENDTLLGNGYYIIRFAATNLGSSGIYELTVFFNWTGPVQKYYDRSAVAFVKIIGEASELDLIDSAEPTPYLGNLSYTYLYSELYSGNGISNLSAPAGNVFIYIEVVGQSFSPSLFTITEDIGNPGYYSIEFNSTIFAGPGTYTMIVYVNWSKTQEPFYGNWTDTVSVRIIPRSTLINLIPPESTPFGVNATFSFSFDDVAEGSTYSIANSSQMSVTIGLPDFSITYNESTRMFHVSFNTSILGAPLGNRQFTIGVTWTGAPYYANVTGRPVIISVRFRETEFDYSTISPTPYGDNVTLHLTFTDITLGPHQPINDGSVTLYNGTQIIPISEYSFTPLGNGEYEIELKTTYFNRPGTYSISVEMSTGHFYYAVVTSSRSLSLRYRLTVLLVEPVEEMAYNNSLELVFHYSDLLTLADIGNTTTLTSIQILNGSSWFFTSIWRGASEDYLLTVQTYNQNLEINREYVLWIEVSYPDASPFYLSAEAFVSFTLRERATNLELTSSPEPTQYLENVNFTAYYQDSLSLDGIAGATITLTVGGMDLVEGVDYVLQSPADGFYFISLNTTALGPAGTTVNLVLRASWTSNAPYYSTSIISLTLSVTKRNSVTETLVSTTQVKFLENVTFTIRYSDEATGQAIQLNKDHLLIYSGGVLLPDSDFSMNYLGSNYEVSINSTVLFSGLISNWNITFYMDWQDNVAPYYSDGRASARVTVVNRVGVIIRDVAPTVPIYDNMTFNFEYVDDSTGIGINDAIVSFDCFSPSGLIEGTDFWIFRNEGNYSILVDSTSLGGTGTFTFSLRLLWSPTLAPFYRNTTTIFLQGSVRLIQAQLTNEEPDPSTVPINDNVSVILNLIDLDHGIPISGAEGSFSVRYKTNASGPATWSITLLSPGVYELVVDCSDAGATGTNSFIITLSFSDYQTLEIQVPFQIRLRQGELNEFTPPGTYFGEATYVIVELVDKDAGDAPISGATLIITWPDIGYTPDYTSIGPGLYNITLTTTSLDAGLYTLIVGAQISDYFISDISIPIQIQSIPTELILPQTIQDVYWGEPMSIWAMFNDTRDSVLISGATLVYQFGVLSDTLIEGAPAGNYSFTIDTGNLAIATTYVVSITATLKNYVTVTGQLTVNVLKLPIGLTIISEAQPEVFKGTPVNITVYVNNTYSNLPLLGATVRVTYIFQDEIEIILTAVPGKNGYYSGFVDTTDLFVGEYVLTITAERTNYLIATTSATAIIKQISTSVWLDALTSTYSTRTFNWSDTIRIGVYVLAPSLNESYPLSTGLTNCTVLWSLSGTAFTGEFLNGTSIGGPGYFYFDFETWDYSASTYTLRITAYPNIGMFAYSSNLTTLIIESIETSVESTYLSPKIWGWTGWVNLTYWDLLYDRGIAGASVTVDWDGTESLYRFIGNGTYQVFINASLVSPGIYPVSVRFLMDNYKTGTGIFTLIVKEVPTAISVFAPTLNQIDEDSLNLQVPYGDILPVIMFYNDTWYNRGIPGATEITGVVLGPGIPDRDYLSIEEISNGNYSLLFDTTRWTVSQIPYRVILSFFLGNWSRASINIQITIIHVPTGLQIEGSTSVSMSYGAEFSVWVFYYDTWVGHAGEGIAGGSINATSLDTRYVIVSLNQSDPSRSGWYEIRLRSQRTQGSTIISVILSKENYESASVNIAVSVEPSDFDILLERAIIFGVPIGIIILAGVVLWTRLFSVPKRLREIRGMVRTISRGKIPEPPDNVPTRQEMVADLFNDIAKPVGISKTASSMPGEAITTEVPEIEELLVQLSILSKLTPDELEDFKLDVSKMKLSEQVTFVKEVINQEAIKQGRTERKPMETILEETAAKARAILAGEEIDEVLEREPVKEYVKPEDAKEVEETILEPIEVEEVDSTDMLGEDELKEIRQRLMDAGIKGSELETIMDQTRELPRELAEELLKSILGKGGEDK
ncbi:MAG: LamG-like jellyroll fold domain-containing protein [Candidatus Thorarchaeota archaeon SMTZ1-45]